MCPCSRGFSRRGTLYDKATLVRFPKLIAVLLFCLVVAAAHAALPYRLEMTTHPSPPAIGGLTPVEVRVNDAVSGAPVPGATVRVKAYMPAMPMGEVLKPASEDPRRPGVYVLPWSFSMAGQWAIEAEARGPKGTATAQIPLEIGIWNLTPGLKAVVFLVFLVGAFALVSVVLRPGGRLVIRRSFSGQNVIAFAMLVVVVGGVILVVRHYKRGQVDWNAMSMDMVDFQAPTAVEVAKATRGNLAATVTYTGTVAPFIEQNVYPRVEGYLTDFTLYPGSKVKAGQVLGFVTAPELSAKTREAQAGQRAASHEVVIAESEKSRQAQEARAVQAEVQSARDSVGEGRAALFATRQSVTEAAAGVDAAQAAVTQAEQEVVASQANDLRSDAQLARQEQLLHSGFVARREYETAQAEATAAHAAVEADRGKVTEMRSRLRMAKAQFDRSKADVLEVEAKIRQLTSELRTAGERAKTAQEAIRTAQHVIENRKEAVNQAAASTESAHVFESLREVRATASGVVTERLVSPGVLVNPQTAIARITQLDRVRLQANVAERDLASIHIGTPVIARAPFLSHSIRATVTALFPAANAEARTETVEAVVDNRDGRFAQGQYLSIEFQTEERPDALSVPMDAVVQTHEDSSPPRNAVWTVVKDGEELKARQNFVTLGFTDGKRQEIRSGLKAGDVVITRGQALLTDGSLVQLPESAPAVTAQAPASAPSGGGMTQKAGPLTVALTTDPEPPKSGDVTLRFHVTDAMGREVSGAKVHLDTSMPTMKMGGPSADAKDEGGGRYSAKVSMMMGGPYRVEARIRASGQLPATARFDFDVN